MPKGAKKGAGGKQVGLTEEERLLVLQQRTLAEQQMAKRKEDMLTQFLKDKLQKEEQNSHVNRLKLTDKWRTLLRQARAEELRHDIAVLSQTFERVVDRKDNVIKSLVCDLKEAKQQSEHAMHSHLENVDRLEELHRDRLSLLEQEWRMQVENLRAEFDTERERIMSQHQQECAYLEDVSFAVEQHYRDLESEARLDYQSTCDDIKNKTIEEKNALRLRLEGEVEELWRQLQQAKRSYGEATDDRRMACEALRARDQSSSREIDTQMKKLQRMQDSIAVLRSRLSSSQRESEMTVRELQVVKKKVALQGQQLKAQLNHIRAKQRSQLSELTIQSSAATKKLQAIIDKGEKLMWLAARCRKLETEREKVLPFYGTSLSTEEQSQDRVQRMEPPANELARAMHDYWNLEGVWQRYNHAELDRLCLQREQEALSEENAQLRALLRQYMDGLSVSDKVLRCRNPLLMVSRPARHERASPQRTCAHVVQHTS
ncbi:hypothetical protein MATL_G00068840 [Megalops atlanticus]|uniref:Dynein regulatory complex subunit 2 n=1 Tax=Megalops atlanticus TaxID=7932 RepID=A0A9D3TEJ6_MEGAT|nr:hypothetical protein MATL_G00068840 [Megalops atlanticus]